MVLTAKRGTEAPRQCLSCVTSDNTRAQQVTSALPSEGDVSKPTKAAAKNYRALVTDLTLS